LFRDCISPPSVVQELYKCHLFFMVELKKEEVDDLRDRFWDAFERSVERKIPLSIVKENPQNYHIKLLYQNMRSVFDLKKDDPVISFGSIAKLLFREGPQNFRPDIYDIFIRYISAVDKKFKHSQIKVGTFSLGVDVIDQSFIELIEKEVTNYDKIKFYTAKLNDRSQWKGIVETLDEKRSVYTELKSEVLQCFYRASKIIAILTGKSGTGKTTTLRRLAFDVIEASFITLWVTDISGFNREISNLNPLINYLVIIEDWNNVEKDAGAKITFLNFLPKISNIRVVIGDYNGEGGYLDYLYGNNIFELPQKDNKIILKKIGFEIPEWRVHIDEILKEKVFNIPLFAILFILARLKNIEKIDTEDMYSQFLKILRNDQLIISKDYPGLVTALNLFALLYREYKVNFTWQALLKLSDFLGNNKNAFKNLNKFSGINSVCCVVDNYISLQQLVHPHYDHLSLIDFRHDVFVNAFADPFNKKSSIEDDTVLEVVENLIEIDEMKVAGNLFSLYRHSIVGSSIDQPTEEFEKKWEVFESIKRHKRIQERIGDADFSEFLLIIVNAIVEEMLSEANISNDKYWRVRLLYLLMKCPDNEHLVIQKVTTRLLDLGCESSFIKSANDKCKDLSTFDSFLEDLKSF